MAHDDETEIRAVLDTSAMLSYARGHVHVGELLVMIADEGAYVGLPTVALLDAHSRINGAPARARLRVLATLPSVEILPLGADEAADTANLVALTKGDLGRAHAAWAALDHNAYYLTSEPHLAPSVIPTDQVHAIDAEDV